MSSRIIRLISRGSEQKSLHSLSGTRTSAAKRLQVGNNFVASALPDTGETKKAEMRMVVLGAAVGTLLLGAIPASAQVVVHDRDDIVVHRHYDRGHHYGWHKHRAECRTVRVRTKLPSGNVIIKTRQSC
jgi:hypothetical protein